MFFKYYSSLKTGLWLINHRAFLLTMITLLLFNIATHYQNLARHNILIFDEWYHAKFAWNYLNGVPFFDIHPPLGKLMIAWGMWINEHLNPFSPDIFTVDTFTDRDGYNPDFRVNTWGARWLTALFGVMLPFVMGIFAYSWTVDKRLMVITTIISSCDGLMLAESRLSLINIFIPVFGFASLTCFLWWSNPRLASPQWLLWCGSILMGCCISIKFNSLGYLGTMLLIYLLFFITNHLKLSTWHIPTLRDIGLFIFVIPIAIYIGLWMIHFEFNRDDLITVHRQIWEGNQQLAQMWKETPEKENAYCSRWWSWFWLQRPIAYFFQSSPTHHTAIYAISNPLLHYLSSLMVGIFPIFMYIDTYDLFTLRFNLYFKKEELMMVYGLLIGWSANYLPWALVGRCLFLYHYTASLYFSIVLVSYLIYRFMFSQQLLLKFIGCSMMFLIPLAFMYWLPIFIGIPIPHANYDQLFLFDSWR